MMILTIWRGDDSHNYTANYNDNNGLRGSSRCNQNNFKRGIKHD